MRVGLRSRRGDRCVHATLAGFAACVLGVSPGVFAGAPAYPALVQPEAQELTTESAWTLVRERYHAEPITQRVRVQVRAVGQAGSSVRQSLTIRTTPPAGEQPARAWVQAGTLRLELDGGTLRLGLDRPESPWLERRSASALQALTANLPPLPLPQLDLVFTPQTEPVQALTPYAQDFVWESLSLDRPSSVVSATPATAFTLRGRHRLGSLELTADLRSGRLRRAVIVTEGDDAVELTLEFADVTDQGPPFTIETADARRTESLETFVRAARPTTASPASARFEYTTLTGLDGFPLQPPMGLRADRHIVRPALVASVRWPLSQGSGLAAAATPEALNAELQRWIRGIVAVAQEPGRTVDAPAVILAARTGSEAVLGSEPPPGLAEFARSIAVEGPDAVAWAGARAWPAWSRGDGAEVVVLIVNTDGRAVGVIPTSLRPDDVEALRRELREAIAELGNEQSMSDPK